MTLYHQANIRLIRMGCPHLCHLLTPLFIALANMLLRLRWIRLCIEIGLCLISYRFIFKKIHPFKKRLKQCCLAFHHITKTKLQRKHRMVHPNPEDVNISPNAEAIESAHPLNARTQVSLPHNGIPNVA